MAHEIYIKRTLYTAKCPTCGEDNSKVDNPPKERFCNTCRIWIPYKAESFVGPQLTSK